MFDYVPDVFRKQYAETEEEADALVRRPGQQPPPARAAPPRRGRARDQLRGQGRPRLPAGGVFLDIASRLPAEAIRKKLPSMYHQFKELADVDITAEPMEVGPTCHYVMGGVEVDPDTAAAVVPGLFAAGEVAGGMHGSNRLGGNSLSDLLVFGRRAGLGRRGVRRRAGRARRPTVTDGDVDAAAHAGRGAVRRHRRREPVRAPRRPAADDERPGRHHPHRGRGRARPSAGLEELKARAAKISRRRATGRSTRAGTSPSTCRTCSSSRSASPARR